MAVGKCKECGGQVAKSAAACPHCGAKVKKGVGLFGWLVVIFIVAPIAWQVGTGMSNADRRAAAPSSTSGSGKASAEPVKNTWQRREYTDQMTDEKGVILGLRSDNSTVFEFPYRVSGGSYLTISLRQQGGSLDAFMMIDKGQMLCGIRDCKFNLRVGEGPVQTWTGLRSSTHESDIMFIRDARQFQSILQRGEPLRIGIEFHQAGMRTFEFTPEGYPGFN